MLPARSRIRQALVERLTGLTVAGDRVYGMRVPDFRDSDAYPAIYVYTAEERATPQNSNQPRDYWVDLTVEVTGIIQFRNREPWADALDAFGAEIYNLLPSFWPELDTLKHLLYTGSTIDVMDAEVKVATVKMDYSATYALDVASRLKPEDLHPLKSIYLQYDLPEHPNGRIEAEDRLDIPPV
jgi:hypothetical protein